MPSTKNRRKQNPQQATKPVERYSLPAPGPMLGEIPQQTPQAQQQVVPLPGETQAQFFDRANIALESQIGETNQRTPAILKIWQASQNDVDLRNKALRRFTADEFTHQGPRCVFLSHTIPEIAEERSAAGELVRPGREGTKYDRENLQKLVDFANYRIRNSDNFAVLSEGHSPTKEEKASGIPDANALGYAGPFYIGLFGDVKPQWSIWCDEWVHNDDLPTAKKLQRRSPEVWCKEPIDARTMDPIAMLGSETPRLDSGMDMYSIRASDDRLVMRYSMGMATAMPGPSNCFVPTSESGKKHKDNYGASDMAFPPKKAEPKPPDANPQSGGSSSDGNPPVTGAQPDVEAIVTKALGDLMPSIVQAVTDFLNASDPNSNDAVPQEEQDDPSDDQIPRGIDAPEDADDTPNEAAQQPPAPQQQPDPMQAQQPVANPATPATPIVDPQANATPAVQSATPKQPPIDDKHAQYAAMSADCGDAYAAGHAACQAKMSQKGPNMNQPTPAATTNYSKQFDDQNDIIGKLNERVEAQAKRIQFMEQREQDHERYSKVSSIIASKELPEGESLDGILKEAFPMEAPEFERYCKSLAWLPAKADVVETEFYDPQNYDPEARDKYSRGGGTGSGRMQADEVEKYRREAQQMAIQHNDRHPEKKMSFTEAYNTLMTSKGLPTI